MPASLPLLGVLLLSVPATDAAALHRFQDAQYHMGTLFQIIVYAPDEATAVAALEPAFARIAALDQSLSDYKPDSVISQLSAAAPTQRAVDDDVFDVLQRAQHFSQLTAGAFDVTVGPLTKLWRKARRRKQLPEPNQLREARQAVGYANLELKEATRNVTLTRPGMRLDLGGIAKGYAADEALRVLRQAGVTRVLINAGGDIVAGDAPPGLPGWRVGVARLDPKQPPSQILLIQNAAVATSGDAWQFVELKGKRYSHIIDPRTGLGLTERSSVTVIARDGTTADALASAVSVMGVQPGLALVDTLPDVGAIVVCVEAGQVKRYASDWGDAAVQGDPPTQPADP